MRAIVGPDLRWDEVPDVHPGPGDVRIRVHATAVNRADLMQHAGVYPPPPGASEILGLECAGVVDAVGAGVDLKVGDRVCALLAGGGYATHVVCSAVQVLPIPGDRPYDEAAAIPEVFATAWYNIWQLAAAAPGERILVHAGASGVGTAAIQLAKHRGNPLWVTVGSDEKLAECVKLGAVGGGNRKSGDWATEAWAREGFDVILDPVGAGYLDDNVKSLRVDGRLIIIGLLGGTRSGSLDVGRLLMKRLSIRGSTLRAQSPASKQHILAGLRNAAWEALADGRINPVVDAVFSIEETAAAHARVAADQTFGKVVLTVP